MLVDGKPKAQDRRTSCAADAPQLLSVDLTGAKTLMLRVGDGGDGIDNDHADWAGASSLWPPARPPGPMATASPIEPPRLVIPPPDPRPAIHGARIVGRDARPPVPVSDPRDRRRPADLRRDRTCPPG